MIVEAPSGADRLRPLEDWHFWFLGRAELVLVLLERFGGTDPMLDAGCGTGRFVARLGEDRRLVVGLDRNLTSWEGPSGSGLLGDVERLPLAGAWVSTVLARDVLEHVDDRAALREFHRVLVPDGLLIVLVPAWPSLWSSRDDDAGHRRRYTRRTLQRALSSAGFEVVEMRGYQFLLLPLVAASRLLAQRRPSPGLRREEQVSPGVNRFLSALNRAEARWARWAWPRPPTGSSLVAVARKR